MHDRPAYELQITQLAIVQMIIVIFKNIYEAYKFALAVAFHVNYLTGIHPANTALRNRCLRALHFKHDVKSSA
jgi:hypothetical protein